MLLICCPHCGPRDQVEFTYGGDARAVRPAPDAPMEAWNAYVYLRDNPVGPHEEYWQHHVGCRQWFRLLRHTVTHELLG